MNKGTLSRRISLLGVFMLLCFAAVFVQLNNLQVVQAHKYTGASGNPQVIAARYDQPRGAIVSADGVLLAQSVPGPKGSIYKYVRQYPTGPLFSVVTGVFSYSYGLYGVEATYNSYLTAHNKPVKSIGDLLTTSTISDTVTLTLSDKLQTLAQQELTGKDGSIVVLDPHTGAIMAMYANPTYDPNPLASPFSSVESQAWVADTTSKDHLGHVPFTSLAYQDIAFPGSTFKIVTTSAAYEKSPNLVNTPMPYYTCIPPKTLAGQTTPLCNYAQEGCGGTVAQMLPPSCDTGYALLGTKVGASNMLSEADAFGFNQQPPIDLPHSPASNPNEVSTFLQPGCYQNAEIFLAFSSIGQFCTKATPLQMALVAAGIADGGNVMVPHVMSQIRDSQGNLVDRYKPAVWTQPTSPQTAQAITNLMVGVTHDSNGTAAGVFPAQEDVAAKTGTAQVQNAQAQDIATNDWMIAFAPANNPKVAIAVEVLFQPVSNTGAEVAGPIMASMLRAVLGF